MGRWDSFKDLELDLSQVDMDKVIAKLEQEDWDQIKQELRDATAENKSLKATMDVVFRVIDIGLATMS